MIEWIRRCHGCRRHAGLATRRQFQQCLRCLGRQVVAQDQQRVLGRVFDISQPFSGNTVAEQFIIGPAGEKWFQIAAQVLAPEISSACT